MSLQVCKSWKYCLGHENEHISHREGSLMGILMPISVIVRDLKRARVAHTLFGWNLKRARIAPTLFGHSVSQAFVLLVYCKGYERAGSILDVLTPIIQDTDACLWYQSYLVNDLLVMFFGVGFGPPVVCLCLRMNNWRWVLRNRGISYEDQTF